MKFCKSQIIHHIHFKLVLIDECLAKIQIPTECSNMKTIHPIFCFEKKITSLINEKLN